MTEEQILKEIASACADKTLRFQIIIQDCVLYVYINRPAQAKLDYQQLESKIQTAVHNIQPNFQEIALYSRVLGEIEPDWQSVPDTAAIALNSTQISQMMEAITDAVEATNSIVERIERELDIPESFADPLDDFEELPTTADDRNVELDSSTIRSIDDAIWKLDLNQYCFIRNQRLLYAVLSPPKQNIAQLIDIFHLFGQSIQRSQLPILEQYFDQSIMPDLDGFDREIQSWWTAIIMLDSDQKRQFAIWMSRYCMHPEQTSATVFKALQPQNELENIADSSVSVVQDSDIDIEEGKSTPKKRNKPGILPNLKSMLQKLWGKGEKNKAD
ncbi:MAG: hypothetical protein AAFQ41_13980 [Cyanobacteria bacterium J06623_7]